MLGTCLMTYGDTQKDSHDLPLMATATWKNCAGTV